jgi:hypothetical protein
VDEGVRGSVAFLGVDEGVESSNAFFGVDEGVKNNHQSLDIMIIYINLGKSANHLDTVSECSEGGATQGKKLPDATGYTLDMRRVPAGLER